MVIPKEIEIPEGYTARIDGDKVILEPKESEDEKIRKELIDFVSDIKRIAESGCAAALPDKDIELCGQFLDYLERQKEQKPIPKFKVGDRIYDKRDSYNRNIIREVGKDYYINAFAQKMDMAYTDANFEFLEHLDDDIIPNKPTEWSEEDRLHYVNVLEALEYVKGCKSDYDKIEAVKSDIDWLKDLHNRFAIQQPAEWSEDIIRKAVKEVGLTQHQIDWFKTNVFAPKPEWSEEDEAKKERLISIVKRALHGNEYPILNDNGATELITWLKSLLERFNLQPKQECSEEDEKNVEKLGTHNEIVRKEKCSVCGGSGTMIIHDHYKDYHTNIVYDDMIERKCTNCGGTGYIEKHYNCGLCNPAEWSEDDRIRKGLINHLKELRDWKVGTMSPIKVKEHYDAWIAYLEKQKEQKPADVSEKIEELCSKNVHEKIEELCSKYPLNKDVMSEQELSAYHQGLAFGATRIAEYLGEQKPAEWSEEDEQVISAMIRDFESEIAVWEHKEIESGKSAQKQINTYKGFISFIKSLRPQPNTVSTKDAIKFGNLEYERGVKDGIQSEKSRHWKPTKKQVAALEWQIKNTSDGSWQRKESESLLTDLKKL